MPWFKQKRSERAKKRGCRVVATTMSLEDLKGTSPDMDEKSRRSSKGVILVPQPSNDPQDPLNWSITKKIITLAIVTLATFVRISQATVVAAGVTVQGKLYGKTTVQMAWAVCFS